MKKKLLFVLCCLFGLSALAGPISPQEALRLAKNYLHQQSSKIHHKNVSNESLQLVYECKSAPGRSAKEVGQTPGASQSLYYVFSRGTDGGFIIVSGDDRMVPVMACTNNGSFNPNTDNPGLKWWLKTAELTMQDVVAAPDNGTPIVASTTNPAFAPEVKPLITTQWNQGYPYNIKCPIDPKGEDYTGDKNRPITNHPQANLHSATGCISTALAQVFNYWGRIYPEFKFANEAWEYTLPHSTEKRTINFYDNPDYNPFQWNLTQDIYDETDQTHDSEASKNAVADLMFACGVAMNMGYCSKESGSYINIDNFGHRFNLDPACINLHRYYFTTEEWDEIIKTELNAQRPVEYNGNVSGGGGHAFICDGYNAQGLFHINWGWGGANDGYYVLSVLNPSDQNQIGMPVGSGGFNVGQEIFVNVQPMGYGKEPLPVTHRLYYNELIDVKLDPAVQNKVSLKMRNWSSDKNRFVGEFTLGLFDETDNCKLVHLSNYVYSQPVEDGIGIYPDAYMEISLDPFKGVKAGHQYYIQPVCKSTGEDDSKYRPMYARLGANKTTKVYVGYDGKNFSLDETGKHLANITVTSAKLLGESAVSGQKNIFEITFENTGAMYNDIVKLKSGSTVVAEENCLFEKGTAEKPYQVKLQFSVETPANIGQHSFQVYLGDATTPLAQTGKPTEAFSHTYKMVNLQMAKIESGNADGLFFKNFENEIKVTLTNDGELCNKTLVLGFLKEGKWYIISNDFEGKDIGPDGYTVNIKCQSALPEAALSLWEKNNGGPKYLFQKGYKQVDAPTLQLEEYEKGVYLKPVGDALQGCSNTFKIKVSNTSTTTAYKRNIRVVHAGANPLTDAVLVPVVLSPNAKAQEYTFTIKGVLAESATLNVLYDNTASIKDNLNYKMSASTGSPNLSIAYDKQEYVSYEGEQLVYRHQLTNSGDGAYIGNVITFFDYINTPGSYTNRYIECGIKPGQSLTSPWFTLNTPAHLPAGNYRLSPYTNELLLDVPNRPRVAVMNFHRTGDFIRIKQNGKFLGSGTSTTDFIGTTVADQTSADNLFYFNDGQLLSYGNGFYLTHNAENSKIGFTGVEPNTKDFTFAISNNNTDQRLRYNYNGAKYFVQVNGKEIAPATVENESCNLYFEKAASLPVRLNATADKGAFATLWSPVALDIPNGLKAYRGELIEMSNGQYTLKLYAIEGHIPANTGVLLWSEDTKNLTFDLPIATVKVDPLTEANSLSGFAETKTNTGTPTQYLSLGISPKTNEIGFYLYKGKNLSGFRARLALPTSKEINSLSISFDDELTGLGAIFNDSNADDSMYDISGRRVQRPAQGVYIVNGKKVIVK